MQNLQTVETHIGEYRRLIDTLNGENLKLKEQVREIEESTRNQSGSDRSYTHGNPPPVPKPLDPQKLTWTPSTKSFNSGKTLEQQTVSTKKQLDDLLYSFGENTEERLEHQELLYENEDEKCQARRALHLLEQNCLDRNINVYVSDTSSGDPEGDALRRLHRQLTRSVAEHEAACLRYQTEIDMSNRIANALVEKTKDITGKLTSTMDETVTSTSTLPFADALVASLNRWRSADCLVAEQNFAVDLRESIIAEQRDVIDMLLQMIPKNQGDGEVNEQTLKRLDLSDKCLAFWEHQFEPPGSEAGTPVDRAPGTKGITSPRRATLQPSEQLVTPMVTPHVTHRVGSGRRVRRVSKTEADVNTLSVNRPTSRDSSGSAGSRDSLGSAVSSEYASSGGRISNNSGYSSRVAVSGGVGTVTGYSTITSERKRIPPQKKKPPVSASAVHGVESRLKALQLMKDRTYSDSLPINPILAKHSNAPSTGLPFQVRTGSAVPARRRPEPERNDFYEHEKARMEKSNHRVRRLSASSTNRSTTKCVNSARMFASPHSPSA